MPVGIRILTSMLRGTKSEYENNKEKEFKQTVTGSSHTTSFNDFRSVIPPTCQAEQTSVTQQPSDNKGKFLESAPLPENKAFSPHYINFLNCKTGDLVRNFTSEHMPPVGRDEQLRSDFLEDNQRLIKEITKYRNETFWVDDESNGKARAGLKEGKTKENVKEYQSKIAKISRILENSNVPLATAFFHHTWPYGDIKAHRENRPVPDLLYNQGTTQRG